MNLDLIYGTPGESDDDWRASLDAALGAGPDHVSAYALIVEEGTQLARRIRRGEVPMTDDDVHADRYLIADERARRGGLRLVRGVELGDLGRGPLPAQRAVLARRRLVGRRARARTATSGGVRWWNVKHPGAYAAALADGPLPGRGPGGARRDEDRRVERILLELRLRGRLPAGPAASGRPARRPAGRWRTGCCRPGRTRRAAPCSPCAGGCWRTRWCGTWWTDGMDRRQGKED